MKKKRCTKCGKSKPLDEFVKNKRSKNGHTNECRNCSNKIKREWRQSSRLVGNVICKKCNQFKPPNEFRKSKRNKRGITGKCKKCLRINARKERRKRLTLKLANPAYRASKIKGCLSCGILKSLDEFYIYKVKVSDYCKDCASKRQKIRRADKKETEALINLMKVEDIIKNKF